ncbi:MAG: alpha/beta hydrolase [Anaerolineae bacterium]|nr:alpha/beta hydrolase [Anaerolineae bacterium]
MGTPTTLTPVLDNAPYADLSETQTLTLYVPEDGDGPFPLVIFIHGGGFMMGDNTMYGAEEIDPVVAAGYAVASLNYRLSGEAIFPAAVEDVKSAVRWLRANAETYNLDPDRFAAWGGSAGGNLAAMLGTSGDVAEFDNPDLGNEDVSSRVQAVVDQFGPLDFLQMDPQFAASTVCPASAVNHDAANSPESMYLGAEIQTVPELAAAANPITYVTDDDPPFFIQHGTADCNVPPEQSQQLYDALVDVIGEANVTLTFIEGAGHATSEFRTAENVAAVIAFLDEALQ